MDGRRKHTTSTLALIAALLALLTSLSPVSPVRGACDPNAAIVRASVSSDGTQANNKSEGLLSISADGQFVAFSSDASNLISGDTNGARDVFIYDRLSCQTRRVSVNSGGAQWGFASDLPSVSDDGDVITFTRGSAFYEIYVRDEQTDATSRISQSPAGGSANNISYISEISGDGQVIVYGSLASNLVSGDTNGESDVFAYDRQTGQTTRVSVATDGTQGDFISSSGSISNDGRYVAFSSRADSFGSCNSIPAPDIFIHDRIAGQTTCITVGFDGSPANGNSHRPSVSGDGRFVAFTSDASNLVSGDTNNDYDVFVHDQGAGETTLVSVATNGTQGNEGSDHASISADGRYIAFVSYASNLVSGDTNNVADVFVHDRLTSQTARVSVDANGVQANGYSDVPAISDDGRHVAFISAASNLVSNDTNNATDVFLVQVPSFILVVNTTDDVDDGTCDAAHCSLREALLAANAAPGTDTIAFDIPGSPPYTIQPAAGGLPQITDAVIIDGTTQPDYVGPPIVVIDGSQAGNGVNGLAITGGNSTVRGLVINQFTFAGIFLASTDNVIEGNYIGTDASGFNAQGNRDGVYVIGANNRIGGTTAAARNVISGNTDDGVNFESVLATGNVVQGNYIGTTVNPLGPRGNIGDGIKISAASSGNTIGGFSAGEGNVIAFNVGRGIYSEGTTSGGTGNAIWGNSIHSNNLLGIDLAGDGVTANDNLDADSGPNNRQNYPIIDVAGSSGISVVISADLDSAPQTEYIVEFFANTSCDSSGNGEGQTFIGRILVTTDASGHAEAPATLAASVPVGSYITATATDPDNNTSEFSPCAQVIAVATPTPTNTPVGASADLSVTQTDSPDPVAFGGEITYTITVTNNGPNDTTATTLTDDLPIGILLAAVPSQGSCSEVGGFVTCNLGGLAFAASATVTIVVSGVGGVTENVVSVSSDLPDFTPGNNTHTETTTVLPTPTASFTATNTVPPTNTPTSTPTPLLATPTATNTQLPAPPAFVPAATLTPSETPTPLPTSTPTPVPTATNPAFLQPSETPSNTPIPPPPPLG